MSPDMEAERLFSDVTGFTVIPGNNRDESLYKLRGIITKHKDKSKEYLFRFWNEWLSRKYSKSNTNWLDWAVADEIPVRKAKANETVDSASVASEVYG